MCKNICKLCDRLVITTAVTFTTPNLVLTIPQGSYDNNGKYCIVIAQSIPDTTPINAPIMVQIGTGTTLYPMNSCDCRQLTAQSVRTRTKYSTVVRTNTESGSFNLIGRICNLPSGITAIDGTQ